MKRTVALVLAVVMLFTAFSCVEPVWAAPGAESGKAHILSTEDAAAIEVYQMPYKTQYNQYEEIDFSNLILKVYDAGGNCSLSDEYTISGNTDTVGTAYVTVTCKGCTTEVPITVYGDISKGNIQLTPSTFAYDTSAKQPGVIVKDAQGQILWRDIDYTLAYSNNKNAGKALVTVTGTGYYKGSLTAQFTITPVALKAGDVRLKSTTCTFTGKALQPAVTVSSQWGTLKEKRDYTLSYSANKNPGTATVVVKGTGNYTGTIKKTFKIVLGKVKSFALAKGSTSSLSVKWKAQSGVSGYQLQMYNGKKWVTKATTNKTGGTISKLSANKAYSLRVRSYKKVGSKKYYSAWTTLKAKTAPRQVTGLKNVYTHNDYGFIYSRKIKWNKQKGVSGYQVKNSAGVSTYLKGAGSTSYAYRIHLMHIQPDAKIYVRAYNETNGKKVYGAWSKKIWL